MYIFRIYSSFKFIVLAFNLITESRSEANGGGRTKWRDFRGTPFIYAGTCGERSWRLLFSEFFICKNLNSIFSIINF